MEHAAEFCLKSTTLKCPVPVVAPNGSTYFFIDQQRQTFLNDFNSIENNGQRLDKNGGYHVIRLMSQYLPKCSSVLLLIVGFYLKSLSKVKSYQMDSSRVQKSFCSIWDAARRA
jgi:hypothetical protein